jgi:hypothetical protein
MATLAATNITTAIAPGGLVPHTDGAGLYVEVFRVAGSGTAGDTIAITPRQIADIRYVRGNLPASDNLSQSAANTGVTLTYGATFVTTDTVTYIVEVIGLRPTT